MKICNIVALSLCTVFFVGCQTQKKVVVPTTNTDQKIVANTAPISYETVLNALDGKTVTGSTMYRFLDSGVYEIGSHDAPHTLVVFTEYHCAYCWKFFNELLPRFSEEFIENGTVKIRVVPHVLEKYPNGQDVSKGLICAGSLGKAKQMHEILLSRKNRHKSSIFEYAKELQIPMKEFTDCFDSDETKTITIFHENIAKKSKVTLLPTLILDGEKSVGLPHYADLRGWVEFRM